MHAVLGSVGCKCVGLSWVQEVRLPYQTWNKITCTSIKTILDYKNPCWLDSTRLATLRRLDSTRNFCWLDTTWLERDRKLLYSTRDSSHSWLDSTRDSMSHSWLDFTRDSTSYWLDLTRDSTSYRLDSTPPPPWLDSTRLQHCCAITKRLDVITSVLYGASMHKIEILAQKQHAHNGTPSL